MNRWPTIPLGELISLEYGKALKAEERSANGRYPVYGSNGIVGTYDKALVIEPTIVVGRKGAIGEAHLAENGCWPIDTAFYTIFRQPGIVLLRYLLLWFRSVDLKSLAITATIPGLNRNTLYAQKVPVPPIAEQERIVKSLDEADELRKLRAQADRRTAALIPALFHETFGDPAMNPKHWPMCHLRELCYKFSDGPFGSNLKSSHYKPDGVRVIRLQNIGVGNLVDDDRAYISPEHFEYLRKHECLPGDVIVGTLGDPNLRACIIPRDFSPALNKADCVQIRPNPEIATAEFICWLLNLPSTLAMASGMIHGQTRARISMGRLSELVVPVPPILLQKEFAMRVAEIRALEAEQAASRRRLEELFQSLLYQSFRGELQ